MPNRIDSGTIKLEQYLEALELIKNEVVKLH
jgi:hypothetical protein